MKQPFKHYVRVLMLKEWVVFGFSNKKAAAKVQRGFNSFGMQTDYGNNRDGFTQYSVTKKQLANMIDMRGYCVC